MADFIYCGTLPPVDSFGTQQLLLGPYKAIWCPPMRVQVLPAGGDRIWLVWRSDLVAIPLLLGGGRVATTHDGQVLWRNSTLQGVRQAAQALGYGGPTNMAFLHLTDVVEPDGQPPVNLGVISAGLNPASMQQVQLLTQILDVR